LLRIFFDPEDRGDMFSAAVTVLALGKYATNVEFEVLTAVALNSVEPYSLSLFFLLLPLRAQGIRETLRFTSVS
jgi:hypothetical protein